MYTLHVSVQKPDGILPAPPFMPVSAVSASIWWTIASSSWRILRLSPMEPGIKFVTVDICCTNSRLLPLSVSDSSV